jgi:hypothetical protein
MRGSELGQPSWRASTYQLHICRTIDWRFSSHPRVRLLAELSATGSATALAMAPEPTDVSHRHTATMPIRRQGVPARSSEIRACSLATSLTQSGTRATHQFPGPGNGRGHARGGGASQRLHRKRMTAGRTAARPPRLNAHPARSALKTGSPDPGVTRAGRWLQGTVRSPAQPVGCRSNSQIYQFSQANACRNQQNTCVREDSTDLDRRRNGFPRGTRVCAFRDNARRALSCSHGTPNLNSVDPAHQVRPCRNPSGTLAISSSRCGCGASVATCAGICVVISALRRDH